MDAVHAPLHLLAIRVLHYLNDWVVCAPTEKMCLKDMSVLVEHIKHLGLHLNMKKSKLEPSQVTQFLGLNLDSRNAIVTLT